MLVLSGAEVASVLRGPELLEPLAGALMTYSAGTATSPPRAGVPTSRGWLGAMPAHLPGVALAAKLVTVFPANTSAGQPSHQGIVALFDAEDGRPLCVMDARHITAVRTAAVSALSVRELARPGARVLAVLGAGEQAKSHLQLVPTVRQFTEIRLAARSQERAQALAAMFPDCQSFSSFEAAVRGAHVVLCCTDSPDPVVRLSWLSQGAHLVSVGTGPEVDEYTLREAHLFVEWRGAVRSPPPAGAAELQGLNPEAVTELGEVLAGTQPGRLSADEVTVFKSTGLGVEDAAVARVVYDSAKSRGLGVEVAW
ncbi:MAG TPA: ornithine cyclodeaminase family protein [Candidatus Dormibacteraeota bacterium]|nr:ornithine cyclodeaminase family protein [Candidatus Dormibacteraeota bacterium]